MTPSVALRALFEQLVHWHNSPASERGPLEEFFTGGPITPPHSQLRRPIGDPVFEAVAEYATYVIARSGQLTTQSAGDESQRFRQHRQLSAHLRAIEHALAVDFERLVADIPIEIRSKQARATLALAAFWCDRRELLPTSGPAANELLGKRPNDTTGSILWEHAVIALSRASFGSLVPDIDLSSKATSAA